MESGVEFYVEVFKLLGRKPSVRQLRVLYFINENRHFSIPDMVDVVDISRTDLYPAIRYFEKMGLIEKIPKPDLPEDWEEWSKRKRRDHKKRVGITRRQYYRFNPTNLAESIDKKVEQLKAMKVRLIGLIEKEEE